MADRSSKSEDQFRFRHTYRKDEEIDPNFFNKPLKAQDYDRFWSLFLIVLEQDPEFSGMFQWHEISYTPGQQIFYRQHPDFPLLLVLLWEDGKVKFHTFAKIPLKDVPKRKEFDRIPPAVNTTLSVTGKSSVKRGLLHAVFELLSLVRVLDEKAYPALIDIPVEYML